MCDKDDAILQPDGEPVESAVLRSGWLGLVVGTALLVNYQAEELWVLGFWLEAIDILNGSSGILILGNAGFQDRCISKAERGVEPKFDPYIERND
jgi:hypothetical protein